MTSIDSILSEFDARERLFVDCANRVSSLASELLLDHHAKIHSITSRVKDRASLKKKLERPDKNYQQLGDITDIVGLRIITYFDVDVDVVAQRVVDEFAVDEENSIDKRKLLESDRFGYLSLHYVASFDENRSRLHEYRRFEGIRFEIQVRSILQHAWAEIEHDLGYKSKQSLPNEVWRRFYRLAGLLEVADAEFARIRDDLRAYESAVREVADAASTSTPVDRITLLHFVRSDSVAQSLDRRIAAGASAMLDYNEAFFGNLPGFLHFLGVENLGDLHRLLVRHRDEVLRLALAYHKDVKRSTVSIGASILYLCYVVAWGTGGMQDISRFLDRFSIAKLPEDRERFIELIWQAMESSAPP